MTFLESKEGKETERILSDIIPPTLKEPGNIAYVPNKSIENPRAFIFNELWENEKQ
ncbi:MAG TPA: antibiotic biosynthesis monooxygenase family protein [Nitrososphaeraceae archaeon]|nr:antibiotic biosynthesis monooxygenase family protein [Nitrososphaeraceae archaeon]